jgi:hypothetical protein
MKYYSTAGNPRFKIVRPVEEIEGVHENLYSRYGSGVGVLYCLIKHSCPDIANVVRELSKCMDSATMLRVTKSVTDTESYYFNFEPTTSKEDWDLVIYSCSARACYTENQIRVTPIC